MAPIYLDHNASTPLAATVAERIRQLADQAYGNPSSPHFAGQAAHEIIATGRQQVARLLGCAPDEIVFTSGGSEANNFALKGSFFAAGEEAPHIITTRIEHPSILNPCRFLERLGAELSYLDCDRSGLIDPADLEQTIRPATRLISIMHANNETGTVQPIAECARIARVHGIPIHTDAAQTIGKLPTRVEELGVDLLSLAGHKFCAPKGIGALYLRRGVALEPLIHGAGHESGRRAGTESALLVAALGEAAVLAADLSACGELRRLRDHFWQSLQAAFGDRVVLNGHPELRLPNTLNVSLLGFDGAELLARLDGVAASTGSACHAGRVEPSPVLAAMGTPSEVARGAIRFSLGRATTWAEVDAVVARLADLAQA